MRSPSIISKIINEGANDFIDILRDNPSLVLKFCDPEDKDAIHELQQEKKVLSILGHHQYIARLDFLSEFDLVFEYYPLDSLREYYSRNIDLSPPQNHFH